jgi:hypothetical protein
MLVLFVVETYKRKIAFISTMFLHRFMVPSYPLRRMNGYDGTINLRLALDKEIKDKR